MTDLRSAPPPSSQEAWACRAASVGEACGDEIDLSIKNVTALRKALALYLAAGRQVRNSRGARDSRTKLGADNRIIKEWARANGYEVNDGGRIPNNVREAFEAAN